MSSLPENLIVFDGVCILCNRFTKYIIKHDVKKKFTFTSYQFLQENDFCNKIFDLPEQLEQNIAYHRKDQFYRGATAVLFILKDLHGNFHWSQVAWILPRFARDFLYQKVAARRYLWFGRLDSCAIPSPEIKNRFLESRFSH